MKSAFHHRRLNLIILGALAIAVHPSAHGVPTLRVSDGVNTVTITDNGLGDANPAIGAVFFIGPIGDWTFTFASGVTKPLAGSALQPFMDILTNATSNGPGTLTIQFSEDSYGPAFGPVLASIGGILDGPNSSITFSTFASSTNTQFAGSILTPEQAFTGGGPYNGDAFGSLALPANFALTEKLVITHSSAGTSGADAALSFEGPPVGGPLTTYTMGGWGAKPAGNNPARFLADNFSTVYPSGLTLGGGFKLKFTSAKGIENFLPCGGPAAALKQSYLNPPAKLGVLAGQVVALTLGVDFSNAGVTAGGLSAAKFKSGKFAGKTVGEVLALAQSVLGGAALPPGCSYSDLSDACTLVNENYDEGANGGKLIP